MPAVQGLYYKAADHVDDVVSAWEMVYANYRRAELIDANRFRLHAPRQAFAPRTIVVTGRISTVVVTTLSAFVDGDAGLPLDEPFADTLDAMRRTGGTLLQVGLFADRRRKLGRATEAMFQLMRVVVAHAVSLKVSDVVIGVDASDGVHYARVFGFEQAAGPRPCATLNQRPIQLMRLRLQGGGATEGHDRRHAAVRYLLENPVAPEQVASPVDLSPEALAGTLPGEYWQWRFGDASQAVREGAA